jgi:3-hydroxyisobutyrate dehydrogenase-like beta-hydroxyacid dehydrogenase
MRIAFLGMGAMGSRMAGRLLAAGHELTVYNRTPGRAAALAAAGARVAESAAAAVAAAEGVLVMVRDGAAAGELLFGGGPDGAPAPVLAGRTVIQMSTIAPGESVELAGRVARAGGAYLEAPVLGSTPQAEQGKLLIMAGGEEAVFTHWEPALAAMGPEPARVGGIGSAATMKLALNQLLGAMTAGFAASLGLVERSGGDSEAFMALLRRSPLASAQYEARYPRMHGRSFSPATFALGLLLKDLDLVRAEAAAQGLDTAAIAGIRQLAATGVERGLGQLDSAALYEVVAPRR